MNLIDYRTRIDKLAARQRFADASAMREAKAGLSLKRERKHIMEAQGIVQAIAQQLQRRAHERIAKVVARCLGSVFEEPYGFEIRFDRKRGKTEARMVFSRDGLELDDPLNEIGGGVIDVAALALRLARVMLGKPPGRRLLVLDEPFAKVRGRENRARTRAMVEGLAEELGFQFVLSTDITEFQLGRVIEV